MKGVLKARKVTHMTAITQRDLPDFLKALATGDIHTTTIISAIVRTKGN